MFFPSVALYSSIGIHLGLTLPIGFHLALPEPHYFLFPQPIPETLKTRQEHEGKIKKTRKTKQQYNTTNKVAWPCTRHNQNHKSRTKKSKIIESTKLSIDTMTQPHGSQCSQGKLNLSLLQDSIAVSFSMQSPTSYYHKHIIIYA